MFGSRASDRVEAESVVAFDAAAAAAAVEAVAAVADVVGENGNG